MSWQYEGRADQVYHCHCSMCRKAHGAPFGTYVGVPPEAFVWKSGESSITRFESSPDFNRSFCSNCGSVAPDGYKEIVSIPAGCMDDDTDIRVTAHIFATSKASWHAIGNDLPRFETYPNDEGPVIERPGPGPATPGVLRGSCLCGGVAYEVRAPLKMVHNCHCSRCRKARAAAHTTNGFTKIDGVSYVRGGDKLKNYKVPQARYFTQVFCKTCGAGRPRLDAERDIAVIP
ncbi:MAG: GFA family protein, partial [Gammaproteobacteria bacterium]